MKKSMMFGAVTVLLLQLSCKDNVVEPPLKDPRTYTFTVDTLAYPGSFQTSMRDIWASSPQSVWIVGHNDRGFGKMFHYDGKEWKPVDLAFGGIDLSAIYGFGADNIFAVGERIYDNPTPPPNFLDSSLIIHYDGRQWREEKLTRGRRLQSIWGSSSFDVWSAGANTLFHYDGTIWQMFPIQIPSQGIQFFSITGFNSGDVYMMGYRNDVVQPIDTLAYLLYHFDGRAWSVIDSLIITTGPREEDNFGPSLFAVGGELFSVGYGIFRKVGSSWERQLTLSWPLVRVQGISSSSLFAVGTESQVYHYNGVDWYRYPQFRGLDKAFTSVWAVDQEVFVVGNDGQRTYILHGK